MPLEPAELRDRLTMLCAPVGAMETLHAGLGDVVVGQVLEVRRHPNADRLSLCLVEAGGTEPLSVVCGAANVAAGRKYPFARVGVVLPGGLKLERRWVPDRSRAVPAHARHYPDHRILEARSLALHCLVVRKMERDPGLLGIPRANLDRLFLDVCCA